MSNFKNYKHILQLNIAFLERLLKDYKNKNKGYIYKSKLDTYNKRIKFYADKLLNYGKHEVVNYQVILEDKLESRHTIDLFFLTSDIKNEDEVLELLAFINIDEEVISIKKKATLKLGLLYESEYLKKLSSSGISD